jgi:hypothetical protein
MGEVSRVRVVTGGGPRARDLSENYAGFLEGIGINISPERKAFIATITAKRKSVKEVERAVRIACDLKGYWFLTYIYDKCDYVASHLNFEITKHSFFPLCVKDENKVDVNRTISAALSIVTPKYDEGDGNELMLACMMLDYPPVEPIACAQVDTVDYALNIQNLKKRIRAEKISVRVKAIKKVAVKRRRPVTMNIKHIKKYKIIQDFKAEFIVYEDKAA